MGRVAEDGGGTGVVANNRGVPAAWGLVAKPCDCCSSAAALLFCRTDSLFMCMTCDSKMHATNKIGSRHERVWMCEVCEQAPASVTCKADAAALCVTCDHDIHSANPLARRHERSPVVPFYDTAESVVKSTAATLLVPLPPPAVNNSSNTGANNMVNDTCHGHDAKMTTCFAHESYMSDPWISSNPMNSKLPTDAPEIKSVEFLFSDSDNYLDFDYRISSGARIQQHYTSSGTDGVVPVQTTKPPFLPAQLPGHHQPSEKHFEIDFTKSHISSYTPSYTSHSLSQSVSSSSLDVGVVPDGSSVSEISYPFGRNLSGSTADLSGSSSGGNNQGSQLPGMDREARVLRYREKRKNRKFEKTIRYASRKAYAETRPRIKGRFAKRAEAIESEIDQMFTCPGSAAFFPESRYGVVPSF
ncbi:zinc finger protein CONSTANS-LIKE 5-like [Coffea arabica]|uniref:Zinc finger protein CONSTANS-LIKE 5-like n=1 Tax=Coffea arabica TaxID=13443 RepID=A0A6P6T386_COFAR|nr:zinc finger protein CONSTANS-LIKE 4-like [Coffea arabica]